MQSVLLHGSGASVSLLVLLLISLALSFLVTRPCRL